MTDAILSDNAVALVVGATFGNEYERMIHDLAASHGALRGRVETLEALVQDFVDWGDAPDDDYSALMTRARALLVPEKKDEG